MKSTKLPEQNDGSQFATTFLEGHPYPILRLSSEGKIVYANPASMPVLIEWNKEVNDVVSSNILEIVSLVSSEGIAKKIEVKHGQVVIELTFSPSQLNGFVDIFGQDISIQKIAQKSVLESRDEASAARQSLERAEIIGKYGSWEFDLITGKSSWSTGLYSIFGFKTDEVTPSIDTFKGLIDPSFDPEKDIQSALENPLKEFRTEYTITRKDKERRRIRSVGRVVLENGKATKLIGTIQDVTDLVQAQEEAQFYKSALDQAAIVAITDAAGVINYINDNFCKISGYERNELIGKTHKIVNSGVMGANFFRSMWKDLTAGKIWKGEICNRAKDGTLYWVDTSIIPFLDSKQKPEKYMAIRLDITQRKKTEQELRHTREVALTTSQRLEEAEKVGKFGSWEWNIRNHTVHCSKGFFQILQAPEDAISTYDQFINHVLEEDRRILEPALEEAIASKQPFSCNYRIHSSDGAVRWLRSEGHPQYDEKGAPIKLVGTSQDVTEKMYVEFELTNATLKAESASKAKAEFLANMSHEIRTPINGVIGMCNLLLSEVSAPSQVSRLKIIQNCGNTLLNLINDILDFSKLEAGKIELENEPFEIHHTTKEIVQLLSTKALEKNVTVEYLRDEAVPPWVLGDTTRFRQVLSNLVSNAIKFTEKGRVTIQSKNIKQFDGKCEIQFSVKDTGIGIPESAREKLFNSFSQADVSTTRKFGGSGLGLVICKGLCERMGGKIWFESEAGKGSTFYFTLVLAVTSAREETSSQNVLEANSEMGKNHPLGILIAEDNRVNQLVAVGLLEKLGYRPDVAANGLEVLDTLKTKKYDLIFMDFHMPEMDGLEATKKIVETYPKSERPTIVALTASAMKEDVDKCFNAGMNDFISKPIQLKEIIRVLSSAVNSKPRKPAELPVKLKSKVVFDVDAVLSNFSGLEDVLMDCIENFLRLKPTLMENIRSAIEMKDSKKLEISAHTMKGTISNFFAEAAKEVAWELEKGGGENDLSTAEENYKLLVIEIEKLVEELHNFKSNRKAA